MSARATFAAVLCKGDNSTPRIEPSGYGQTGGGSCEAEMWRFNGGAAHEVGTPRVIDPRCAGNAYLTPCIRNSFSADRLGPASKVGWYNKPETAARFTELNTWDALWPNCLPASAYVHSEPG